MMHTDIHPGVASGRFRLTTQVHGRFHTLKRAKHFEHILPMPNRQWEKFRLRGIYGKCMMGFVWRGLYQSNPTGTEVIELFRNKQISPIHKTLANAAVGKYVPSDQIQKSASAKPMIDIYHMTTLPTHPPPLVSSLQLCLTAPSPIYKENKGENYDQSLRGTFTWSENTPFTRIHGAPKKFLKRPC